ncbi:unnamed protein product [Zymoseptoria tritici ST99CH_3D1]|nr:unnamed protein product [Zymoseptoria tritici ST99CH_3D1]
MKVRSVLAAFALVGATSAAPSIQNIEERQAPTCGVLGNDKGWYIYSQTGQTITNCYSLCQQRRAQRSSTLHVLRQGLCAPNDDYYSANDDDDSAGNNNDAADHHNNATDHDNATAEYDNAAADYHNLLRQANEQHDLAGVNDIQPSGK